MSVFKFKDYKEFLAEWIGTQPKDGYGQMGRMAKFLNISSVSASHIFKGSRHFSEEQAVELSEFLGLTEIEADYFLLLIQFARAGSVKLRGKYERQLEKLRSQAQNLKSRIPAHADLDDAAKGQFYSNWYYSAVRLLTGLPGFETIEQLANALALPRSRVADVMEFLLQHGLCVEENGRLNAGPQRTHTDARSPFASAHHRNWRLKAIEKSATIRDEDLFFSGPMTLSMETFSEIRQELADTLARITKKVEPSPSEILACVNFDLFRVI